jgi:quinoprotein glucose dehydrogenase
MPTRHSFRPLAATTILVGSILLAAPQRAARAQTAAPPAPAAQAGDWSAYGHDAGGTRYAPLSQITRQNVAELVVAWTYRTGEMQRDRFPVARDPRFEATPLMVGGTLYLSTPLGRAIALDPATGHERWTFDAKIDIGGDWGDYGNRGVSTWVDPAAAPHAPCKRRIYLGTVDAHIIALDARTGTPCAGFGSGGRVDLRRGLRNALYYKEEYELTSPPAASCSSARRSITPFARSTSRVDASCGKRRSWPARAQPR